MRVLSVSWLILAAVAAALAGCGAKSYPTIESASGYRETGDATFYADKYVGRTTASGEIYRHDRLTAAHPSLPFGLRVRVTHRENGRSVIVRINDRFPGQKGRVVDLSRGAFQRLAPPARGVIPVVVEAVD